MGLIQMIIDFFKKLFGGGDESPALSSTSSHSSSASAASPAAPAGPKLSYEEEKWRDMQKMIAFVESGGLDLAGCDPRDPKTWWVKQFGHEQAQMDGKDPDEARRMYGFRDRDHMDAVGSYMNAKWSTLETNDDGEKEVKIRDEFMDAAMEVRNMEQANKQAAAANADPTLLEPVAGVTIDQWAGASSALSRAGNATPQQLAQILAQFGMDKAKYDAANAGWQAKMQGDTTFVIATKFGAAFSAVNNVSADGPEPCSFDKYVEIMAAQAAWAEQGFDIQAKLKQTFGIDIASYGAWSSYWSPKMQTQAYHRQYLELDAKYKAKYAGAKMDDDLSL